MSLVQRPVEATRIVAGLVLERSILLTQEIEPWQQAYEDIEWDRNEDLVEVPKEMQVRKCWPCGNCYDPLLVRRKRHIKQSEMIQRPKK